MPKAVINDVVQMGFAAAQFDEPRDWDVAGGFIDAVLSDAELRVVDAVSQAVYDAATSGSINFVRLRDAEKYFCAAELWRRRAQFIANESAANRTAQELDEELDRCRKSTAYYEGQASKALDLVGRVTAMDAGLAMGVIETGSFSLSP